MRDSLQSYTSPAKSKIGDWAVSIGRRRLEALAPSLLELPIKVRQLRLIHLPYVFIDVNIEDIA